MTSVKKLLSIASAPLAPEPIAMPELLDAYTSGPEIFLMLREKNGFYAFEAALHVFPITGNPGSRLEGWNADSLWRKKYKDLADGLLFFGEDILQDQFCLSAKQAGILRFHAETGNTTVLADSVEEWARLILSNDATETGWPFVDQWQAKNGPLPIGKRLMPKIPFSLGGEYKVENLWAGDPLQGMRLKADLAMQTRHLPERANVRLNVAPKPII